MCEVISHSMICDTWHRALIRIAPTGVLAGKSRHVSISNCSFTASVGPLRMLGSLELLCVKSATTSSPIANAVLE